MKLISLISKAWHHSRIFAYTAKILPSAYYLMRAEIEKRAQIERLNQRFHCRIDDQAILRIQLEEDINISEGVIIGPFTSITVLREFPEDNDSKLYIGANSHILEQNNIRACGGAIYIGKHCLISQQVSIIGSNHSTQVDTPIQKQPWDRRKTGVWIGNDVWVGCGVQIMPGVRIGNGAIIGAGSLVNRDVESNTIVAGVPARRIGHRQ